MKPEKITIDFATYEKVFTELARYQQLLKKRAREATSEKIKELNTKHAYNVQELLEALVDAEFNEE